MNNHHLSRKAVAALLAATLAIGSPAWAAAASQTTAAAQASASAVKRFPDVAADHWANKYISKLSLLGIIEGNEKGMYEPEESVTQEQVITMAIRMMGLEGDLASLPAANVGFELTDYAKPYVQMALEKGLIDFQEEKTLFGLTGWGTKKATREWVAKLAIRAIGKQSDAAKLGEQDPPFTDNASVSVWAKGYINEAAALKIVDGMEDGSFKPKDPVTRAQMAAFLSRAGKYMADVPSKTATGIIDSVSGSTVNLVDDYGTKTSFTLGTGTVLYGTSDATIKAGDLKADNKVFLILSQGTVQYVEVLEEKAQSPNKVSGKVIEVDSGQSGLQIRLTTDSGDVVIDLDNKLTILNADGKGMKLSDLVEGVSVDLKRTSIRSKFNTITITHIPVNKTAEGVVQALDADKGLLSVKEKDAGVVQYPLEDSVSYLNNGVETDIKTLVKGDTIRYRLTDGKVNKIDMVTPYVEPSDSGKLVDIRMDKSNAYITIQKADSTYATYSLATVTQIVIPGMDTATYSDLLNGDAVKVLLTEDNKVYKVTVSNRSLSTELYDTIVNFDPDNKLLLVKTVEGQARVFTLNDSTKINIAGNSVLMSGASTFLAKGKRVDITASSDTQVKEVRVVYDYTGTVLRTNTSTNELTLQIGNAAVTVKLNAALAVYVPSKSFATLADVAVGDKVTAGFDSNTDTVTRIQVNRSVVYRLTDKDVNSKNLTLKDSTGTVMNLNAGTSVSLYNQYQSVVSVADLALDDLYVVSYVGNTVTSVTAAATTRGAVTAVDPATGKLSYTDNTGTAQTITLGANVKVKREGNTALTGLTDLRAGDRIEAAKGSDGVYTVWVASVLNRPVDNYDAANKLLYVYRSTLDEKRSYSLSAKVYIHKGNTALSTSNLTQNTSANLYILDGKIVEIEVL